MNDQLKEQILAFLAKHPFCTVATVTTDAEPEAAFVGFSSSDSLELIIGTSKLSRKYQNLIKNPHIAVVVADTEGEVQYEGVVQKISDEEYEKLVEGQHYAKLPGAVKYRTDPNQIYLKIVPKWLRFIQHGEQDTVTELTEFEA